MNLLLWFGSLSCCITKLCLGLTIQADAQTCSFKMMWYRAEFMGTSDKIPTPSQHDHRHHHNQCWYDILLLQCWVGFMPGPVLSKTHRSTELMQLSENSLLSVINYLKMLRELFHFFFPQNVHFPVVLSRDSQCLAFFFVVVDVGSAITLAV